MKRLVIFLVCLILVSCRDPNNTTIIQSEKGTPVYVLNTVWKVVKSDNLSRSVESTDAIVEEVKAHNVTTINDIWRIYVGSYPTISDSPNCDVYIVYKDTHLPVTMDNGVGGTYELVWKDYPRQLVIDNIERWKDDANRYNADLYIDVVPPAPIITKPTQEDLYAKYTINVISHSGELIKAEHCTDMDLTDWHCTIAEYFQKRVQAWNFDIQNATDDAPWHMVTGKLYEVGD